METCSAVTKLSCDCTRRARYTFDKQPFCGQHYNRAKDCAVSAAKAKAAAEAAKAAADEAEAMLSDTERHARDIIRLQKRIDELEEQMWEYSRCYRDR